MGFSRSQITKFTLMLVFLACMLFANFFAVRKMMSYGVEVYFYDKLQVAYDLAGAKGLNQELEKIRLSDNMPRELPLIKDFEIRLESLKDPGAFLNEKVEQGKKKVNLIRNLRSIAIVLMILIFGWRMIINFRRHFKP